jgi:hypothetical protein
MALASYAEWTKIFRMKRVNLKAFEQKLRVRPLRKRDYAQVALLQKLCFPGMSQPHTSPPASGAGGACKAAAR